MSATHGGPHWYHEHYKVVSVAYPSPFIKSYHWDWTTSLESDNGLHVLQYLAAHDTSFLHHPALWVTSAGIVPTRSWFLRRLHHFGGNEFSGHSMRAGGATALAAAGMALDLIRAAGRWSSDEFNNTSAINNRLLHRSLRHTSRTLSFLAVYSISHAMALA
ncbi:uncharacterized protein F5147DRAFT_692105 [Suillus discolor]|uniref:Uncharacterized protein n=1 Tax=Suillus discolor TaxID=1912936 RepID=A0A9P7FA29_9AGAM|nr:uncharacterized protein F5147DRAFT_692105 [Suillus discolor]KAG2109719.1 hypothetical protein F5147DRAFT_692105 [Suillus discolor]